MKSTTPTKKEGRLLEADLYSSEDVPVGEACIFPKDMEVTAQHPDGTTFKGKLTNPRKGWAVKAR